MASADTDFYSDDPVEETNSPSKKKFSSILAFLMLLVGGTYLVQTTLAANISLNTGSPIEFGQGITATAACSGATDLTITPYSSFTNASGAGAFYFSSVKVSNIQLLVTGLTSQLMLMTIQIAHRLQYSIQLLLAPLSITTLELFQVGMALPA